MTRGPDHIRTEDDFKDWLAKQPAWARRAVDSIERQRDSALAMLREQADAHEGSNVQVDPYRSSGGLGDQYAPWLLPKDSMIRYRIGDGTEDWHNQFDIKVRYESDGTAYLDLSGSGGMLIEPQASNRVHIYRGRH